jgi:hypothetical protein
MANWRRQGGDDMILDCHVHLPSPGLARTLEWAPCTRDLAAAASYLRRCGVERVVASSARAVAAKSVEELIAGNDETAQAAKDYPGFIVAACQINTNFGPASLAEIRRCHDEFGIVWVGELCGYIGGYRYDTEAFLAAMQLASDLNMVVQIHEEDAEEMSRLCAEFPDVDFVLAHLGDSPEECKRRCELAAKHQNLHLDICGHGYQRMGVLELAVQCAGPDRVLFGSDYTINDPAGVIARVQHADFDDETKAKILGGNTMRLLGERGVK